MIACLCCGMLEVPVIIAAVVVAAFGLSDKKREEDKIESNCEGKT
jgi:hypothetical protein